MEKWKIVLIVCVCLVILIVTVWLIRKLLELRNLKNQSTLETCFGEPLYSDYFTLKEAKDWIKERESQLKNGCKAIVLKATKDTMKSLGKEIEVETNAGNFLVIAIVNGSTQSINDSVLIKYDSLDDKLEEALGKGNGVLVIGG